MRGFVYGVYMMKNVFMSLLLCAMLVGCTESQVAGVGYMNSEEAKVSATDVDANAEIMREFSVYFEHDSDKLSVDAKKQLVEAHKCLKANLELKLKVVGHADDTGSREYNLALGERRAHAVRNYLLSLDKNLRARIHTSSKGKDEPAIIGTSPEARAQNRRSEISFM